MSREKILNSIRTNKPEFVPLPCHEIKEAGKIDLIVRFNESLTLGGGKCDLADDQNQLGPKIKELFPDLNNVYSNTEIADLDSIDRESIKTPHDLKHIDLAVIQAEFGVAENGAVWVDDRSLEFRAVCFLTQHLAFIVKKDQIVENMTMAYQRISFDRPGFGCFIAGPSKTADIEQSLVIGAHGARSTAVLLI